MGAWAVLVLVVVCVLGAVSVGFQSTDERERAAILHSLPAQPPFLSHEQRMRVPVDAAQAAMTIRSALGRMRRMYELFYATPDCPRLTRWMRTTLMSMEKLLYEVGELDVPKKDWNDAAVMRKAMEPFYKQLGVLARRSEQEVAECKSTWFTYPGGKRDDARFIINWYKRMAAGY